MAPLRIVRAVNPGTRPFRDMCDSQDYKIDPGSETLIPFDAAILWFGNPDTLDIDARRRDRTDEYARVRVRYGIYEHEHRLSEMPEVEIFTLDGERIFMVKDDPDGSKANPGLVADDDALRTVQRQLLAMQAQQAQLLEALAKNPDAAQTIMRTLQGELPDVPDDAGQTQPQNPAPIVDNDGQTPPSISDPTPTPPPVAPQPAPSTGAGGNPTPPQPPQGSNTPPTDSPDRVKVS